jgi:phage major head subunit gpT-like protein
VNAGYGLWQLGYASKGVLTGDAYGAVRKQMMSQRGDRGRILGIVPNVMVVPPELENAARRAIVAQAEANGATNPWAGTCELIVSPYLAA